MKSAFQRAAAVLGLIVFVSTPLAAQARFFGNLKPGKYTVGFAVTGVRDTTRRLSNGEPRPVQIAYWYPAAKNPPATSRLTFRDYIGISAGEHSLQTPPQSAQDSVVAEFRKFAVEHGTSGDALDKFLGTQVLAFRDAPAEQKGRFPILLIAQGNGHSAYMQALFAEWLASQGYYVATTPSPVLIQAPPSDSFPILDVARDQQRDLELARDFLAANPRVNSDRIGVIGHSFGARPALLMMKDERVRALISLDGGIGNAEGKGWLSGAGLSLTNIKAPVLHFYENVEMTPDMSTLQAMNHTERTMIRIADMHHVHFTSLGNASGAIEGLSFGPPTPEVLMKLEGIARLSIGLLHQQLYDEGSRFPVGLPSFFSVSRLSFGSGSGMY